MKQLFQLGVKHSLKLRSVNLEQKIYIFLVPVGFWAVIHLPDRLDFVQETFCYSAEGLDEHSIAKTVLNVVFRKKFNSKMLNILRKQTLLFNNNIFS